MGFNSFQKNPFINSTKATTTSMSNIGVQNNSNYTKLGRKTVEQVQEEMNSVKFSKLLGKKVNEESTPQVSHQVPDYKNRVNNLRNINRQ